MEFIIFLIFIGTIYVFFEDNFKNNTASKTDSNQEKNNLKNSNIVPDEWWKEANYTPSDMITKPFIKKDFEKETQIVINNYYTQNNTYVQQNNYYKKPKIEDENKVHSEKVWKRLGYKVKHGETYSYKMYGKQIFKPDQVEKIGSYQIRYSQNGLAQKLIKNTGSKSHAKNILVDNYGLSKSEAQRLVNEI